MALNKTQTYSKSSLQGEKGNLLDEIQSCIWVRESCHHQMWYLFALLSLENFKKYGGKKLWTK